MPADSKKPGRVNLSKPVVEGMKPPKENRVYHYDSKQPGLALCITPAGTKTFYVYRKIHGKPERVRLGAWPEMNVAEARTAAAAVMGTIANGNDPNAAARAKRKSPTFQEMFDEFVELPARTKAKRPRSAKTVKDYRLQFNGYLAEWHHRKLSTMTKVEVEKLHNKLAADSGKYTANRVLALVKALFNTAIDCGYLTANPAARVRGFEEETRERFLTEAELPKFFAAVEEERSVTVRDFIWLALYTAQRRGNVLSMKWVDVDLNRGVWTMPTSKTGRHAVPLTEKALEVLLRREKDKGQCEYVLPGRHGYGHLQDPMRQWRAICEKAGVKGLRIHDLRRTAGSWMAMTGSSLPMIGKSLGHTRAETTQVYARLADDPVRQAMKVAADAIVKAGKAKPKGGAK